MDSFINPGRIIDKLTAPLKRRILTTVRRCILATVDDDAGLQEIQIRVLAGELLDGVERMQNYGLTTHPHPGAEGVVLALGGNRNHSIVIAVDDRRYRLNSLTQGEVALYDDQGQAVHIKRDGLYLEGRNICLKTPGIVRLEGEGVEIHGRSYVQTDVAGKGSRETNTGGVSYHRDTWTTGSADSTTEHGLHQPAIPSNHPSGHLAGQPSNHPSGHLAGHRGAA